MMSDSTPYISIRRDWPRLALRVLGNTLIDPWPGGEEETFGDFGHGATYELRQGNGEPVSR